MPDNNLQFLVRKNLLHLAQASAGTELFRHIYVLDKYSNQIVDTMQNGRLSCAYFVSGILAMLMLIDHPHSTVPTTMIKMEEAGWYKISTPRSGAIVHWPEKDGHQHLGFYIDETTYISNHTKYGTPKRHGAERPKGRLPDAFYWHPRLDEA